MRLTFIKSTPTNILSSRRYFSRFFFLFVADDDFFLCSIRTIFNNFCTQCIQKKLCKTQGNYECVLTPFTNKYIQFWFHKSYFMQSLITPEQFPSCFFFISVCVCFFFHFFINLPLYLSGETKFMRFKPKKERIIKL